MSKQTLQFYTNNNQKFIEQYNSVSFESVHKDWLEYLPDKSKIILDVGAGSGRDALWLSNQGYQVIAVEPVAEFYKQLKNNFQNRNIDWLIDSLPKLNKLEKYNDKVSLILLSAVWMHLSKQERIDSFQTFAKLSKNNGLLVISLRHGKSPDERLMHPVSTIEIENIAKDNNYKVKAIKQSDDKLKRTEVFWETVVLEKVQKKLVL